MRIAETIGCPLFYVDQFPSSELFRWKTKFMMEYYNAHPDKLPELTPDDISVETSQLQLAQFFGVDLGSLDKSNNDNSNKGVNS